MGRNLLLLIVFLVGAVAGAVGAAAWHALVVVPRMNDTGDSSTTEVNQISASVSDTESVPNISESPVRAVAAAELINGAEM
jgi:hypothetical protein